MALDARGFIRIPSFLFDAADWVFDLDTDVVLKNETGRKRLVPLGVEEVTRQWLRDRGFVSPT